MPILTENIPEVYCIGHDERSAQFQKNIADPLTNCDYKQAPIVAMSEIYALEGNGSRPSHLGNGYSNNGTMYTLNTVEVHSVAMSTTGGQNAYAIGNGQTAQLRLQDKVGTLNCMHDQIAVLIATPGESSEVCAPTMAEDSTDKMCRTEN